jgi:hypothetical protein
MNGLLPAFGAGLGVIAANGLLGGSKPAAGIDGNEFVLAAQKYGLGTDMGTMNRMVDLVNNGYSVDAAAQAVSGKGGLLRGAPKPAVQPVPVGNPATNPLASQYVA